MKTHYCFLKKFNNYFNRKIIKFSDLEDYENSSENSFIPLDVQGNYLPFDFNPADDVSTEVIVNDVEFHPDYFLLLDPTDLGIISRWFVMEQRRNRQGQWIYYLRRDVVADHLESLLDSPFFVQKGMLPETDKFILNDEGMSFNQVKQEEKFIKDETGTAWIVGYIAKNTDGIDVPITISSEQISGEVISLSDIATALDTTEGVLTSLLNFDESISNYICFSNRVELNIKLDLFETGVEAISPYIFKFDSFINFKEFTQYTYNAGNYLFRGPLGQPDMIQAFRTVFPQKVIDNKATLLSQIASIIGATYYFDEDKLTTFKTFQNQIVFYNSKYYRINIVESGSMQFNSGEKSATAYSSLLNIANDTASEIQFLTVSSIPTYTDVGVYGRKVYISLNEISASDIVPEYNTTISASRIPTSDQEFDMFVIPLEAGLTCQSASHSLNFTTAEGLGLKAASAIAQALGKELYDIQILPYFPFGNGMYIKDYAYLDLDKLLSDEWAGQIGYSTIGLSAASSGSKSKTITGPRGVHGPVGYLGYNTWYLYVGAETFGLPLGTYFTSMTYSYSDPNGKVSSVSDTPHLDDDGNTDAWRFQYNLTSNNTPPDDDFSITINVSYVSPQGAVGSIIIYCQSSSFQKYTEEGIPEEINEAGYSLKILSNAYYMRICSPNYQGSFDVNIGKNNGKIKGYFLYGTYKPYTPYIKVAPVFESLYGSNFGDQRGLICSGDFSLPRIIDEWQNYQLNNKNYQNIFNREIQNMEFLQSIERRNQIVSGAVGIVGDTVKGAAAGAYVGGGWGAAAGAVLGGGTSAVGYAIDVDTLAKTQRETKQLAIDKFNYQLGNIKALPYTLTNIGAFNINSKIYPFLEIYTPTEEELSAFENKIRWESMTVMRIDTMRNFWRKFDELCYFKAELIRCDDIAENNHMLNAIYEEILKGVYI